MGDAFPETNSIHLIQIEHQVVFRKATRCLIDSQILSCHLASSVICIAVVGNVSEPQNPVTWYIERRGWDPEQNPEGPQLLDYPVQILSCEKGKCRA